MHNLGKHILLLVSLLLLCQGAGAVDDRIKDIRGGNRHFDKSRYRKAELDYRRALVKDSSSVDANYNLANTLYRLEDYDQAMKVMQSVSKTADESPYKGDFNYNLGNVCAAREDWGQAVEAYKKSLLENPGDLDAKENYLYAKAKYEQQQQQNQDQNQDQDRQDKDRNQDQNQDQNQDKDQNKNQDRKQDQDRKPDEGGQQPQEQQMSPQAAQQMLQAIQEKEKQTQEKVEKEKAALVGKKKREKNW